MKLRLSGVACAVAALLACDGGNSSETVGFADKVEVTALTTTLEIRTGAGYQVGLYGAGYLPHADSGFSDTAWANAAGRIDFAGLPAGTYNVLARGIPGGKAAFLGGFTLPSAVIGARRSAALEAPGRLKGNIRDTLLIGLPVVSLPGTPFTAKGDALGAYLLPGLPAGDFEIRRFWLRHAPCDTGVCGGIENRRDTTIKRIEAGYDTEW